MATKDKSFSFVINSDLTKNNVSLSNYKKNWQYADGGITTIYKSKIDDKQNILVDKHSTIKIINSEINKININEEIISKQKNDNHLLILKKNGIREITQILKDNEIKIVKDMNQIGATN